MLRKIGRLMLALVVALCLGEAIDLAYLHAVRATITTAASSVTIAGNNSIASFNFSFVGGSPAYIVVTYTDASGNATILPPAQYTLTINPVPPGQVWGIGGNVVYPTVASGNPPIGTGTSLTIARAVPLTQTISSNQGQAFPTVVEAALDLLEMQIQQIGNITARVVAGPITDPAGLNYTLPAVSQRAGQALCFDTSGNVIACTTAPTGTISSAMAPVVSAGTLAAARTAMGLGAIATLAPNCGLAANVSAAGNLDVIYPTVQVASNQAINASNCDSVIIATGPLTLTLARSNTLWNGFAFWVHAPILGGAVTLAVNAADQFEGYSSGVAVTLMPGTWTRVTTNAVTNGTWWMTQQGPPYANVKNYGATGNCTTDDTAAVQGAINAAKISGGQGVVYFPATPPGGCYLVSGINQTNAGNLIIEGNGDASLLKVNGYSATNHNWWDCSGSNNTLFRDFKVTGTSGVVPKVLFFCAGTSVGTLLNGIYFDHVNIDAFSSEAHLYAYNIAYDNGTAYGGAAGMSCRNSVWYQRKNGGSASSANFSLETTVAAIDGINSRALASDYITVSATPAGSQSILFDNCNFIDAPSGFGAGVRDNNTGLSLVRVGQFLMHMGSVQCLCFADAIMWNNSEAVRFDSVVLKNTDGSGNTAAFWIDVGGGFNGFLSLDNVFFSNPAINGGFIAFDAPVGGIGGMGNLKVQNADVGGNSNTDHFITVSNGCSGFTPSNVWLSNSYVQMINGANTVVLCGSTDSPTIFQNVSSVNVNGGTDASHHF